MGTEHDKYFFKIVLNSESSALLKRLIWWVGYSIVTETKALEAV